MASRAGHHVDAAARPLGLDPLEMRRRNYLGEADWPHDMPSGFRMTRQSFHECLDMLERRMDIPALRAEQAALRPRGVWRGIGVAGFVELTGPGPDYYGKGGIRVAAQDGCVVKLEPSGKARVFSSATDQGQGTDVVTAQIVAAMPGLATADVRVVTGDSETCPYGGGAFASALADDRVLSCRHEEEASHRRLEALARGICEGVAALHGSPRRAERAVAPVHEGLARSQDRLLADNALADDLLAAVVGVEDDPAPGEQLDRARGVVLDSDSVDEEVPPAVGIGLSLQVLRLRTDANAVGGGVGVGILAHGWEEASVAGARGEGSAACLP